mgnify:CR=1 FL=1
MSRCSSCSLLSAPSVCSRAASAQAERPRRLLLDPASELDRLDLPRDKAGLDVYYQKVAAETSAVHKGGARWFIDVGALCSRSCACGPSMNGRHPSSLGVELRDEEQLEEHRGRESAWAGASAPCARAP